MDKILNSISRDLAIIRVYLEAYSDSLVFERRNSRCSRPKKWIKDYLTSIR